jgi:hypothetical protein
MSDYKVERWDLRKNTTKTLKSGLTLFQAVEGCLIHVSYLTDDNTFFIAVRHNREWLLTALRDDANSHVLTIVEDTPE